MDSAEERRHMPMVQSKVWTLEELHSLPDDGNKYELLHGELFVTPAPTFDHETTIARLHAVLLPFVMARGLGYVYSGNSVITEGVSELLPDLLVRQPAAPKTDWKSAPIPILVVEVLSPSTRRRDREFKGPFYVDEIGVAEYWIVDGDRRSITVVRRGASPVTTSDRLTWAPKEAEATLEIDLVDVFGPAIQE
jgi:Uma2 family endonuclease